MVYQIQVINQLSLGEPSIPRWQCRTLNWRYVKHPPTYDNIKRCSLYLKIKEVYKSLQQKPTFASSLGMYGSPYCERTLWMFPKRYFYILLLRAMYMVVEILIEWLHYNLNMYARWNRYQSCDVESHLLMAPSPSGTASSGVGGLVSSFPLKSK